MDPEIERKYALVRGVGEECVSEPELRNLLQKKPNFILYDGFEPSGRMHIAQGTFKAMNVNKCTSTGGTFVFWVADWFALMNDKMGGDLDRIKVVGQYLIQVWTAAGMDMTRVKFLWSSEEISKHAQTYWTQALDIARRFTVTRIKKCCQIMGRLEDTLTAAQILYPIMQCTDIFFLKADICQLGVDQRKVNMLAREYCDAAGIKLKPIILSHHMLYGLSKGQQKMSKSNLDSAIFMEDSVEDVERKLRKAYCPRDEGEVDERPEEESMHLTEDKLKNPCLDYVQHIIFCTPGASFTAGGKTYDSFAPVRLDFLSKVLSEEQLKDGLIRAVNLLLEPVRGHFERDVEAKRILDLVRGWMAEPKTVRATPLRRGVAPRNSARAAWVVFAPPPTALPTLGAASEVLDCLNAAPKDRERVLWLGDWTAYCTSCMAGGKTAKDDLTAICASFDIFVAALRALAPEAMEGVTVLKQSDVILANPNDYWISVINAGACAAHQHPQSYAQPCLRCGLLRVPHTRAGHALLVCARPMRMPHATPTPLTYPPHRLCSCGPYPRTFDEPGRAFPLSALRTVWRKLESNPELQPTLEAKQEACKDASAEEIKKELQSTLDTVRQLPP